jgi:hypothetical protein
MTSLVNNDIGMHHDELEGEILKVQSTYPVSGQFVHHWPRIKCVPARENGRHQIKRPVLTVLIFMHLCEYFRRIFYNQM